MKEKPIMYNRVADRKRLKFIVDNIQPALPSKGSVLDVGCGNGIISSFLGHLGYDVTGIDVSEKAIKKAKTNNKLTNVQFDVLSAENLKVQNKKYNAIICSEVLEHLESPSFLLNTIFHLLNDNGVLIVTVPNGFGPREVLVTKPALMLRKNAQIWEHVNKIKAALGYDGSTIQSEADNLDHIHFFSKKDIYQLAESNNFKVIKLENTNFIDDVFPFSLITKKSITLQKIDARLADLLPHVLTGGFVSVWQKKTPYFLNQ